MIATFVIFAVAVVVVLFIVWRLWEWDNRAHRDDFAVRHDPDLGSDFHAWITDDLPPARVFEEQQ